MRVTAAVGLLLVQRLITGAPAAAQRASVSSPCAIPCVGFKDSAAAATVGSLSALLAREGYVAVAFHWGGDDHLLLDATVDTAAVTLLLDSGFGGELELAKQVYDHLRGVHASSIKGNTGTAYGAEAGLWGFTDRVTLGAVALGPLETYLLPGTGLADYTELLGAVALNSRGAVVDYVADSVYFLAGDTASSQRSAPAADASTLRAALERSGQYRTFLGLMREAGLLPLLEGPSPSDTAPDSLAWRGLYIHGVDSIGAGALPATRERTLAARSGLTRLLRAPGRLTVFAPTDAAFARLAPETLRALRADRRRLVRTLEAHLVRDTYLDTAALRTLVRGLGRPAGPTLGFHRLGQRLDVDRLSDGPESTVLARATVVQPEIATAAGMTVAHGIDRVLLPPDRPTPLAAALVAQDYVAVKMIRLANGMYAVRVLLDGDSATLVVDTGSPYPLVLDRQRLGSRALAPKASVAFASAPGLTIAMEVTPVDLTSVNDILHSQDIPPIDGIVGSRLLRRYGARLDFASGTLYLHKSPLPPR